MSERTYMDALRDDMAVFEVTEEDVEDRNTWRWKFRRRDPSRVKPKGKDNYRHITTGIYLATL